LAAGKLEAGVAFNYGAVHACDAPERWPKPSQNAMTTLRWMALFFHCLPRQQVGLPQVDWRGAADQQAFETFAPNQSSQLKRKTK